MELDKFVVVKMLVSQVYAVQMPKTHVLVVSIVKITNVFVQQDGIKMIQAIVVGKVKLLVTDRV